MRNGGLWLTKLFRRIPASAIIGVLVFLVCLAWSRLPGAGFMALMGAALCGWFLLYGMSSFLPGPALRRGIRIALLCLILLAASLFAVTGVLIAQNAGGDDVSDVRVAVVFGAGVEGNRPSASLLARLEASFSWWQEDESRILVLTGGQGNGEHQPEARVMADWLIARGVPEHRLRLEDRAADTRENVAFSVPILEKLLQPGEKVAAVSNEFHLYRCKYILKSQGYDSLGIPAKTPYRYLLVTYSVRECCAVVLEWLGL